MAGLKQVLITGSDGYLGTRIASEYLEHSEKNLLLWVRADNEQEFESKKSKLRNAFGSFDERVVYAHGNLKAEKPFGNVSPANITTIIHCAAVTKFNIDEETAKAVNVDGTRKVLDFASSCQSLENFNLLSTIYASGLKQGLMEEKPFDGDMSFGNHYEKSKWESENLLIQRYNKLPWRIFRVATVISDSADGRVTQQNAFHNTLKLFYYGLLSIIPGKPETPLYFVTGEFSSKAIFDAIANSPLYAIYHVSPGKNDSVSVKELIDIAFQVFLKSEDFKKRRILKPVYSDLESFEILSKGIVSLNAGIVSQSVSSIAPFSSQLFLNKDVDNRQLSTVLKNDKSLDMKQVVEKTCEYLVKTKWNRV